MMLNFSYPHRIAVIGLGYVGALSDYAVESRYPGLAEPVSQKEYEEVVAIAEKVVHWAEGIIRGRSK